MSKKSSPLKQYEDTLLEPKVSVGYQIEREEREKKEEERKRKEEEEKKRIEEEKKRREEEAEKKETKPVSGFVQPELAGATSELGKQYNAIFKKAGIELNLDDEVTDENENIFRLPTDAEWNQLQQLQNQKSNNILLNQNQAKTELNEENKDVEGWIKGTNYLNVSKNPNNYSQGVWSTEKGRLIKEEELDNENLEANYNFLDGNLNLIFAQTGRHSDVKFMHHVDKKKGVPSRDVDYKYQGTGFAGAPPPRVPNPNDPKYVNIGPIKPKGGEPISGTLKILGLGGLLPNDQPGLLGMNYDVDMEDPYFDIQGNDVGVETIFNNKNLQNYAVRKAGLNAYNVAVDETSTQQVEHEVELFGNEILAPKSKEYKELKELLSKARKEGKSEEEIEAIRKEFTFTKGGIPTYAEELYDEEGKLLIGKKDEEGEVAGVSTLIPLTDEQTQEAQKIAELTDKETLESSRTKNYFELLELSKLALQNYDDIIARSGSIERGTTLGTLSKEDSKALQHLQRIVNLGKLIPGMQKLPGNSEIALAYNDKIEEFAVLNEALQLNINTAALPEQSHAVEALHDLKHAMGDKSIEVGNDDKVRVFKEVLEANNFTIDPEHEIREGDYRHRKIIEQAEGQIIEFIPLATIMALTRGKSGGLKLMEKGKQFTKIFGKGATLMPKLSMEAVNGTSKFAKAMTNSRVVKNAVDVSKGMVNEVIRFGTAEEINRSITGSDGMVYNAETDSYDFVFPMALGGGGVIARKLTQKLLSSQIPLLTPILSRGAQSATLSNVVKGGFGAANGTGLLMVSEIASGTVKSLREDGKFLEAAEIEEMTSMEHLASTYLMMAFYGRANFRPELLKSMSVDVLAAPSSTKATRASAKKLGLKEGAREGDITTVVKAEIDKIQKNKKLSKEEKAKQIEEIENAGNNLQFYNELSEAKKIAKGEGTYQKFISDNFDILNVLKSGGKPNSKQRERLDELTDPEFNMLMEKMDFDPNSNGAEYVKSQRAVYQWASNWAEAFGVKKGSKERRTVVDGVIEANRLRFEIDNLNKDSETNKELKGVNEIKVKRLKEKLKEVEEKTTENIDNFETKFKKQLEREIKIAEVTAKELGAKLKAVETEAEYIKEGGKKGTEGFWDETNYRIVINKQRALEVRQIGVASHEPLHLILRESLKETRADGKRVISENGRDIIDSFLNKLSTKDRAVVDKRINEQYRYETFNDLTELNDNIKSKAVDKNDIKNRKVNEDGSITVEYKPESYYEEHLTVYSDALKNKDIKYNRGSQERIGDVFYPLFKKYGYENLYKGREHSAESAEGLFNLIHDYHAGVRRGEVSKDIIEFGKRPAEQTAGIVKKAIDKKFSKTAEKKINDLGEKYTKEEWGKHEEVVDPKTGKKKKVWKGGKADNVITEIYTDLLNLAGSKAKTLKNANLPGFSEADFVSKTLAELMTHIRNFDIKKSTVYEGPGGLSGWINSQLRNKAKKSLESGEATKKLHEPSIDVPEAKELISEQLDPSEILEAKEAAEKVIKTAPNFRKSLVNEKGKSYITEPVVKQIENAVIKTLGGRLPNVSSKEFKLVLQNSYKSFLKKPIAEMMGTRDKFDTFLKNSYTALKEHVPIDFWVKLERLKKPEDRIFTEEVKRLNTQKEVREAIDKGLIDPNISETAGNTLYKLKDFTPEQLFNFFRGKDVGASTKGTRKDALAEGIGSEWAFDMTMEVAKRPDVMERRREINNFTNEQAKLEISEIAKRINRDPSLKFSKTGAVEALEMNKLLEEIRTKGHNKVFNSDRTLKAEYKGRGFSELAVKGIFDLSTRGVIKSDYNLAEIKNQQIFLQKVAKGKKSTIYEQLPIEIGIALGKKYGLEMLTIKVREGGYADFDGVINGVPFRVEVKMFDSQLPRQLIDKNLNFQTGEYNVKNLPTEFRNIMSGVIGEMLPALKRYNDFAVAEMQALGWRGTEIKNNTLIPDFIFQKAKEKGLQKEVTTVEPLSLETGRRYVAYKYAQKKLSKKEAIESGRSLEQPNFHIDVQSTAKKENGMYRLHKNDPMGFSELPLFDFQVDMIARFSRGSSIPVKAPKGMGMFWQPGMKFYKPNVQFVPKLDPHTSSKSSPYGLSTVSKFKRFMEMEGMQRLRKLNPKEVKVQNENIVKSILGPKYSKTSKKEIIEDIKNIDKAIELGRKKDKKSTGMSTFDFDGTLRKKGNEFVVAENKVTGDKITIDSESFHIEGPKLAEQGYNFDFKDFINVKGGVEGPLLQKIKNQITKYGNKNVYVLTARPAESAMAIQGWLKSKGVELSLENITGLGNSTGEAKALWMLEKFGEGYNDMYFVDDALPNVKAVKQVLNQLDIKSKVRQAKKFSSTKLDNDFNQIIEDVKGVGKEKEFKAVTAKMMGAKKGKWKWVIPPSAADFELLTSYTFASKGKQGEAHQQWWNDNLFKPFAKGVNKINTAKQATANDYLALRKLMPGARKMLKKKVAGTGFTHDAAIRVHRWTEAGFEVPGLSKKDLKTLNDVVNNNPELLAFSNKLGEISKTKEGWVEPTEHWLTENITADLHAVTTRVGRKHHLAEWIENKNIIFSEKNMNKIEALYGKGHREALEDMLYRMEHGTNRPIGRNALTNRFMNWTNNSVGAVMFLNMRSAGLQTLSAVNYINWAENNPLQAAKAFANQPQYWKDFSTIYNSDMLKQRRAGLKMNVNEAEIAAAVEGSSNKAQAALSWLLKKGFTPTQIADSFAIASGGSTFYRNRIKMYEKQGLETKEAEKKAWTDFQEIAEKTQQSARPDLISQQQASPLGRLILAFANTPMQYARIMKKSAMDLAAGRGDAKSHVSRILYYGGIQSMIFASLQSGMFSMLFDDELDEDFIDKKQERVANTMVDGLLRGTGVGGASISAIKNGVVRFMHENDKDYNADYVNVAVEMLNVSPTLGSKFRKLKSAGDTYGWNKDIIPEMGFDIENPGLYAAANVVSATTNVPLDRLVTKTNNMKGAIDTENAAWQRIAMLMGYSRWNLGMDKPEAVVEAKEVVKEKKKVIAKEKREEKKKIELKEKEKEGEEKQEQQKKEGKQVTCLICKLPIAEGKKYCTIHEKVEQRESGKKTQCKKIKSNDKQCKMKTSSKSGYCYYHD